MTADIPSITAFAQKLIQTPSQGGIDSPDKVVETAFGFAASLGLPVKKVLDDNGKPIAVVAEIVGKFPGKTWAVNATLDTAPAGNREQWQRDPFSGEVKDQILYGRGAADSKLAAAMFTHIAKDMLAQRENMHGTFLLILDADEHTGNFSGIKSAIKAGYKPDGIMIGYPGDDKIVIGSRGFSRYEITVSGKGQHSGSSAPVEDNAAIRAAELAVAINSTKPEAPQGGEFNKPPKISVTGLGGGDGYSVIPSKAVVRVDARLTPQFNEAAADAFIRKLVAQQDAAHDVPAARATEVAKVSAEPPFLTAKQSDLRRALAESIQEITGQAVPEVVAGPSNIGNFMAKQGIDVTAGYGVPAKGVHSDNEQANLRQLGKVYDVYEKTLGKLLHLTP